MPKLSNIAIKPEKIQYSVEGKSDVTDVGMVIYIWRWPYSEYIDRGCD